MVLSEEIAKIAREEAINNNPAPLEVKITKVYSNEFVDVSFSNGELIHVKTNCSVNVGDVGVVIFIDGDINNPFCLAKESLSDYYTKEEIDEIISGGIVDLKQYVKKVDLIDNTKYDIDLNLNFGLAGIDDNITIDMDIVDYIVNKTIHTRSD